MSSTSRSELQQKLRAKVSGMSGQRTGSTLRSAKQLMPKEDKGKLLKQIRKKGVRALTEQLGIKDRETEEMVARMIATGNLKDMNDLVSRINQYQSQRQADQMASQGPPPALVEEDATQQPMLQLPSANQKRKTLKPLRDELRKSQNDE